jgi:hypothetical protein
VIGDMIGVIPFRSSASRTLGLRDQLIIKPLTKYHSGTRICAAASVAFGLLQKAIYPTVSMRSTRRSRA